MSHYTRPRRIVPSMWTSERVAELSDRAFRMWMWMVTTADDDGRRDWTYLELRNLPFLAAPISREDAEACVSEIEAADLAAFYEGPHGKSYYQLAKWHDIQQIRKDRYRASTYPPPPGNRLVTTWQPHGNRLAPSDNHLSPSDDPNFNVNRNVNQQHQPSGGGKKLSGKRARDYARAMDRERKQEARVQEAATRDPAVPTSVRELLEQTTQKLGGKK